MELWAPLKDNWDFCHNYFLLGGIRSHPTELSSDQLGPWLFAGWSGMKFYPVIFRDDHWIEDMKIKEAEPISMTHDISWTHVISWVVLWPFLTGTRRRDTLERRLEDVWYESKNGPGSAWGS